MDQDDEKYGGKLEQNFELSTSLAIVGLSSPTIRKVRRALAGVCRAWILKWQRTGLRKSSIIAHLASGAPSKGIPVSNGRSLVILLGRTEANGYLPV